MNSFINIEVKGACWLATFIGSILLISSSLSLLSQPDSLFVAFGITMLVVLIAFWSYVIRTRIQKWKATESKEEEK